MAIIVELLVGMPTRDWGRMRTIRSDKLGELRHCFSLTTKLFTTQNIRYSKGTWVTSIYRTGMYTLLIDILLSTLINFNSMWINQGAVESQDAILS